jgi:predicted ATP-dependent endonuclease of OLD family
MINRIKAKNFKILEFVDLHPKKGVTFIFGPNEAGKSTMMDVVETALVGGKKILNPIRDNQDKAEIVMEIAGYKIKKVFTAKSQRLEVYDTEDNKVAGGLATIDTLVNKIGFDPHQFTRMTPKEQRATLMKLLKLDFTKLDAEREQIFNERREVGAQVKMLPSYTPVELNEYVDKYAKMEEVSAVELAKKAEEAKKRTHQLSRLPKRDGRECR